MAFEVRADSRQGRNKRPRDAPAARSETHCRQNGIRNKAEPQRGERSLRSVICALFPRCLLSGLSLGRIHRWRGVLRHLRIGLATSGMGRKTRSARDQFFLMRTANGTFATGRCLPEGSPLRRQTTGEARPRSRSVPVAEDGKLTAPLTDLLGVDLLS